MFNQIKNNMTNAIKEPNEFTNSNKKKQSINGENTSEYTIATLIQKCSFQNSARLQFVSGIYALTQIQKIAPLFF